MSILSGQQIVTVAGVAVKLGTENVNKPLIVKAKPTNSGLIYIGNNGLNTVGSGTGFVLSAGDAIVFSNVGDLDNLYIDASINNQGVTWAVLDI